MNEESGQAAAVSPRSQSTRSSHRVAKRWVVHHTDQAQAAKLAQALGVSPIVAALLIARGHREIDSAQAFLKPSLDQLHDPFLMRGMTDAVKRLLRAIDDQEPILIYGDYDVDGTTGTAGPLRALRMPGATARSEEHTSELQSPHH